MLLRLTYSSRLGFIATWHWSDRLCRRVTLHLFSSETLSLNILTQRYARVGIRACSIWRTRHGNVYIDAGIKMWEVFELKGGERPEVPLITIYKHDGQNQGTAEWPLCTCGKWKSTGLGHQQEEFKLAPGGLSSAVLASCRSCVGGTTMR